MTNEDLDKLALAADRARELKQKFGISRTRFCDIEVAPVKTWLVRNFLGAGEMSCAYGPPGSAKSLLAGDLAAHIAWGQEWIGRRVTQGAVLFVAIERAALVKRRLAAFRQYYGLAQLPLDVISGSIDLCTGKIGAEGIVECAKQLQEESELKLQLIVIDTVSRALAGGDENSPRDMGGLVANVLAMQEATGAHVLLTHHVPHDQNRMRGHGALLAACDTTLRIDKGDGLRTATVEKTNDGPELERVAFNLESVELGKDPKTGEPTTAPVIRPFEGEIPKASKPAKLLRPRQRNALNALHETLASSGIARPSSLDVPVATVTTLDAWRNEITARGAISPDVKNPRGAFFDLKDALEAKGLIGVRDGYVWRATA
jgi:hypothetical protein